MAHALTADEELRIAKVISALEGSGERTEHVARKHERTAFRQRVTLTLLSQRDRPQMSVVTRDISVGGVGFLSRRLFQSDEHFVLHLPTADGKSKLMLCQTRYCQYVTGALYNVGATFCEVAEAGSGIPRHWNMLAGQKAG
jgi:hypothetical protein